MANGFTIHNFDFTKLMEFAQSAKGDVYLQTADGDVLNLKSKLTQLLATGAMSAKPLSSAAIPMTKAVCSV